MPLPPVMRAVAAEGTSRSTRSPSSAQAREGPPARTAGLLAERVHGLGATVVGELRQHLGWRQVRSVRPRRATSGIVLALSRSVGSTVSWQMPGIVAARLDAPEYLLRTGGRGAVRSGLWAGPAQGRAGRLLSSAATADSRAAVWMARSVPFGKQSRTKSCNRSGIHAHRPLWRGLRRARPGRGRARGPRVSVRPQQGVPVHPEPAGQRTDRGSGGAEVA